MNIYDLLKDYDRLDRKGLDEFTIYKAIRSNTSKHSDFENPEHEVLAEWMAFSFVENYPDKETGWDTYFGPMSVISNGDGTASEWPSLRVVTIEMIQYWSDRATKSTNPILKARYAGLVWDFSLHVTGKKPEIECGKLYVRALLDIAESDYHSVPTNVFKKLERALSLAISFGDNSLIERAKQTLIKYEKDQAIDDKPGLWGYSFDSLINNKRVSLTIEEESGIIDDLEKRLERLTTGGDPEPWSSKYVGERLASYYRKTQKPKEVKRVLIAVGEQYYKSVQPLGRMQAIMQLEQLRDIYLRFGLEDEAGKVLKQIRDIGPEAQKELKVITTKHEIPSEDFEAVISSYTSIQEIENTLMKLVIDFIPKEDRAKSEVYRRAKIAPFQAIIGVNIFDDRGRVVTQVGCLQDDLAGRIVLQISEELELSSLFYDQIMKRLISEDKLTLESVIGFISKSPGIDKNHILFIERGLEAYLSEDYIVTDHVLVPLIESIVRQIAEFIGCEIFKPARGGGYHVKQLDQFLREPLMIDSLGSDLCNYLQILFTDQRGWNLRNNLCHGLNPPEFYSAKVSNRIVHALLCLGALRIKE